MKIYVFVGPTMTAEKASKELEAVYLPPVSQGDVYRVAARKPFAIGIIDGYFDRVPAVWHKEILWAMAQGIHVFGAASMGALRAIELDAFGMTGVGKIYEDFRDGRLEDDDEVAVSHSVDGVPTSEAMVNIRYTLKKAEREGIIRSSTRSSLEYLAKCAFYPERSYQALLRKGRSERLPEKDMTRFEHWLPGGRVDQKLDDAIAMLRAIRQQVTKGRRPKKVGYAFEHTYMWEQLMHEAGELRTDSDSPASVFTSSILEELRLEGPPYTEATDDCLLRLLLQEKLNPRDGEGDERSHLETIIAFREARGLLTSLSIRAWLKEQSLTEDEFLQYMNEEERIQKVKFQLRMRAERLLPAQLRLTGRYSSLTKRAAHKRHILSSMGLETPTAEDVGMSDIALMEWYFQERLGQPLVSNLASYVQALGFQNTEDFVEAVRRERCYVLHQANCARAATGTSGLNRTVEQKEPA